MHKSIQREAALRTPAERRLFDKMQAFLQNCLRRSALRRLAQEARPVALVKIEQRAQPDVGTV